MDAALQNKIVSFIWAIADDCLRDVYVRGKYRDVILPMFVLRRLDCLLEETKENVIEEVRFQREEVKLTDLDADGLTVAAGYVFYNISDWTLKKLVKTASNNRQILEANFLTYLDGFSENVKEIIEKFELRNQIRRMGNADVLLDVLEKFTSDDINLSPHEIMTADGRKLPGLTNLGMGYVFEELIRRFNEENNEEAGEHFTPREVIQLMTHLLFIPVKDDLAPTILVYDGACGSGGMLTESQNFILDPVGKIGGADCQVSLYGKEVNRETYAICKADMMIKENDPENIKFGSTLALDEFQGLKFDFMLSNPPYGKSYKADQKFIVEKKEVLDPRFQVPLKTFQGVEEICPALPRSSDGQLLFLMDMVSKMKPLSMSPLGSRIASVHNGSSLFTGDAGSGESNIRRYIIENDWLEAIVQLPQNLFYNTGITTYIWILSNKKSPDRWGKVQLIDASQLYRKLRKNLGAKNCEFAPEHIEEITDIFLEMQEEGISKVFDNEDFGFYKVTIDRPLRLAVEMTGDRLENLRYASGLREIMAWCYEQWGDRVYTDLSALQAEIEKYIEGEELNLSGKQRKALFSLSTWEKQRELLTVAEKLQEEIGEDLYLDFNIFSLVFERELKGLGVKLGAAEKKQIFNAVSWSDERGEKVVKRVHKLKGEKLEKLLAELETTAENLADFGFWPEEKSGEWIEYETDSQLRDTENVPLNYDPPQPPLIRGENLENSFFIREENASFLKGMESAIACIHAYFLKEVRPHVEDAWITLEKTQIGYEISFNKYFYQHQPLRSLEEVTAEILQLERETEGLLKQLVSFDTLGEESDREEA
ncbi:MAG: class I SAM-dependent DNA methyltransferase [Cyanobacteria bacterium P01_E01_bin.42]